MSNQCKWLFALFITGVFFSCKKDVYISSNLSSDQSYFPLKKGFWIEYEADSVIHLDLDDRFLMDTSIVTFHFFIREEVDSAFTDAMGEQAFSIGRYRRLQDSLPWSFMSRWTAKLKPAAAERVEENQRFVKLSFPFNDRKSWNGNAYNSYEAEDYTYDDLFESTTINTIHFDSSITVVQNDFISNINRIYKIEKYAPSAGMVYKQLDSLNTILTPTGFLILNGFQYSLRVKDYQR